jgi:hypothetical protein
MGEERRFAKDFCGITDARDHSGTHRSPRLGQHIMQGTLRRTRGFKKLGEQAIGKSRGGWNTKLHVVSANDKVIVEMHLPAEAVTMRPRTHLIAAIGEAFEDIPLLMDRAYEGDETRALAATNGHEPIVPQENRKGPLGV